MPEPTNSEIMAEVRMMRVNLYGGNGHEGDIPRMMNAIKAVDTRMGEVDKRVTSNREGLIQLRVIVVLLVTALGGGAGVAKLLMG